MPRRSSSADIEHTARPGIQMGMITRSMKAKIGATQTVNEDGVRRNPACRAKIILAEKRETLKAKLRQSRLKSTGRVADEEKPDKAKKSTAKKVKLPPIPKSAAVPRPTLLTLSKGMPRRKGYHRHETLMNKEKALYDGLAQLWARHAPVFRLPHVDLQELETRPTTLKARAEAEKVMQEMEGWVSDPFSGIWGDKNDRRLLAVFSWHLNEKKDKPAADKASEGADLPSQDASPHAPVEYQTGPQGHPGRSLNDFESAPEKLRFRHGFPKAKLSRHHEATQYLHSVLHPVSHARDSRHDEHVRTIDLTPKDSADLPGGNQVPAPEDVRASLGIQAGPPVGPVLERVGVTHLVHGWEQQGHPGNFAVSTDFVRNANAAQTVEWYFQATQSMARRLAAMFKVAFPDYYQKYRRAFNAGVWTRSDPGPWLGRAIVWKLDVYMHRDGLDGGPTATFPMGAYQGGEFYLPDLRLKLTYRPGDVVISLSGLLYHAVGAWKPDLDAPQHGKITPGRISHVFFFPKKSLDVLEGKPPLWALRTGWGKLPDSWEEGEEAKPNAKRSGKRDATAP
ncbi:hypothetical protein LshimejAT787_0312300 [Lyophyllum shimeji]|uniref:Uncharacterized protein n=1 Tax=Lyophyllum shimeji TaxID=47721 RepID=A0A9P3PJ73_LYOSH|nr:hypothetical protein LshimejAT787_0312300 [Lyophyllum shimeji]